MPKNLESLILNQDNRIDIQMCYHQTGIKDILAEMDSELIGLKEVKQRLNEISSVLLFDRIRKIRKLPSLNSSLHMAFTGSPGTGKTSVAAKMALVLRNLGYLTKGHITNVTREDLVGQYVGHTAPKTKENLQRAQGGILFIDEAHHLYKPDNERDYGSEAIELLLQVMENQREDLILIFAGNKKKIDSFFNSNPGISSRIGNHIDFQDYNVEDLTEMSKFFLLNENRYKLTEDALNILIFYIKQLKQFNTFSNARTLKVFINLLLSYQSGRIEDALQASGVLDYDSFITIKPEDFQCFTENDFINIIGSEKINLFNKLSY